MSRKRKPVLQLGAASSKLHKYGYSKEFHSTDKKGKSSLPTLVGNYSDSEGDDSAQEGEELAATGAVAEQPVPELNDAPAAQHYTGNGDTTASEHCKSPDMDDELKNFLSEIEAIPMPTDGGGNQDQKSDNSEQNTPRSVAAKEAAAESVPNNGDGLSEHRADQDVASSSTKSKHQYSMFVKGASEFVHSPSSQDCETSATKEEEAKKEPEDDIPEEPTSCWQLVQDEGSQYYYYWNTHTNEVTWEIPSEYTQFLLLHREFTEKLGRLPPSVLKAYEDRKAKETEALASASTQSSTSDPHSQQAVYGPASRASPTPASVTADQTSSTSHRPQKKHRKEKKKRRHKRRHSDSSSDSSDAENSREASKTPMYGPQLPQGKQSSATSSVTTSSSGTSSTSKSSAGSQLLSIVPYLSDADEDENKSEDEDEGKVNSTSLIGKKKTISQNDSHIPSSGEAETVKNNSDADADHRATEAKLGSDVSKLEDTAGEISEKVQPADQSSELSLQLEEGDTSVAASKIVRKVEKPAREVIDMFAEEAPQRQQSDADDNESAKGDDKTEREEKVRKGKESNRSSHTTLKDFSSTLTKTTASSFSSSPSSPGPKSSLEEKKSKSKDKKDAANLLNIVGYGSDEEEQTTTGDKEAKDQQTEVKREEAVPISSGQSSSQADSKKRKKEKKKHRHDDRDKREGNEEKRDVSPPAILTGNLGKDIKARVEETLDKEISDIVIQTVSQTSLSALAGKLSSDSGHADKLPHQTSKRDRELKAEDGKESKRSKLLKDEKTLHRAKEDSDKTKVSKHLAVEKSGKPDEGKPKMADGTVLKTEPAEVEKEVSNDKDADEDDDDIDFEDLDDLDRALEVALEKKKVELAKYEEQERKQHKQPDQTQESEGQSVAEHNTLVSSYKAEDSSELEEKLKAEVRDVAELALSKLEFLDISTDNLSRLQILFIELQTRLHDWTAGGLSTVYFQEQLGVAQGLLEQYEQSAVPQGWACQWDRGNNRYYYRNLTTNRIQWDYPDEDPSRPNEKLSSSVGDSSKIDDSAGKNRKEDQERKPSSGSKREKSHDRGSAGRVEEGGSGDDKDSSRKKGGGSSRHRKREERDKDRGSKHDKRREGSGSSHRYRRKRRRRRDHSSSSDSSDDDGGGDGTNTTTAVKASSSSTSRRHHRSHHKASKKKKKRRSEQRSRSPSVEIVAASDDKEEDEDNEKSTPSITVLDASPPNSSAVSTPPHMQEGESDAAAAAAAKSFPHSTTTLKESIDGEPLLKNGNLDKVGGHGEGDANAVSLNLEGRNFQEEGEIQDEEEGEEGEAADDDDEEEEEKTKDAVNPAVIYKPPQLVVPPQVVAAARQPELYAAAQPASAMEAQPTLSLQAQPTVGSGFVPAEGQSLQAPSDGKGSSDAADDAEKQARKKKKEKKLATGPSLMMKKKHMSSMVQKWQKVKKEVEKEDRAKEMRQAAIRKKIEELK